MIKAPTPIDEAERIKALKELEILDTGQEEEFDRLTAMAARLTGCKIALISLVDTNRQWFKSKYGFDKSETARDISFCGHTIMQDDQLIIEDARKDERFFDNPLVTGPDKIVFYVGTPLIRPSGARIGTLCILDHQPKKLHQIQLEFLRTIADAIVDIMETRVATIHLSLQNHYSELYQQIANIGGWSFDINSGKITWSNQMYELFPEDINDGEPDYDRHRSTIHPEDVSHWEETVNKCVSDGAPYKMRFRVQTKEDPNKYNWIEAQGEGVFDDNGKVEMLMGTCRDISREIEFEEQKQINMQQSKLASLGQMAAGVAHEVNNPLAIIQGYVDILIRSNLNPEAVEKARLRIKKSVERIRNIVEGLRKFSRKDTSLEKQITAIQSMFSEIAVLTLPRSNQYGVKVDVSEGSSRIKCNQLQIEQVLVNLVHNAIDATHNSQDPWVKVFCEEDENNVRMIVQDSGNGIEDEVRDKLFDPFFTKKDVNQGTGLGLSISLSIVKNNGGNLEYKLIDGHTAFVLTFKKHKLGKKPKVA